MRDYISRIRISSELQAHRAVHPVSMYRDTLYNEYQWEQNYYYNDQHFQNLGRGAAYSPARQSMPYFNGGQYLRESPPRISYTRVIPLYPYQQAAVVPCRPLSAPNAPHCVAPKNFTPISNVVVPKSAPPVTFVEATKSTPPDAHVEVPKSIPSVNYVEAPKSNPKPVQKEVVRDLAPDNTPKKDVEEKNEQTFHCPIRGCFMVYRKELHLTLHLISHRDDERFEMQSAVNGNGILKNEITQTQESKHNGEICICPNCGYESMK